MCRDMSGRAEQNNHPSRGWRVPLITDLLPYITQDELPVARTPPRPGVDLHFFLRQTLSLGVDGIGPEDAFEVVFRSPSIPWPIMSFTPNPRFRSLAYDDPRVRMLLTTSVDDRGWTPMHWAAARGDLSLGRSLLVLDAHLYSFAEDGSTPAIVAARRQHRYVERFIVRLHIEAEDVR